MDTGNKIFRGCPSGRMAGTCAKLEVYDWLGDVPDTINPEDVVEIRFKNTRKDYYINVNKLALEVGDIVAVEASPGHDIGMVSLTGDLVLKQMKRHKYTLVNGELRKVYRKAKPVDIEKWEVSMQREHETMIRSRKLAADLKLNMKIGDVEYQGDGTKAIFYYIADDRVDFRQLIKVLAENFRIRVEMKQIGARQEAGRIGGIGPCGRELCCCTWMSSFSSVTTSAARYQEISLNPQKLAGQCSKLKCCLNYEVDSYLDEQKDFPPTNVRLETQEGNFVYIKSDVFKRTFWYSLESDAPTALIPIPVERVHEIIRMNRKGQKPEKLLRQEDQKSSPKKSEHSYENVVGQDSLTRFDKQPSDERRSRKHKRKSPGNFSGGERKPQENNEQDQAAESKQAAPVQHVHSNHPENSEREHKPRRDNRDRRQNREPRNQSSNETKQE
jgi:cell fate regulator YaaT (PSP1 superfamily)